MSKSRFLSLIRRFFRRNDAVTVPQNRTRNLRLMQLEDRRVLNASFAFNGVAQLVMNDFSGAAIESRDGVRLPIAAQ